MTVDALIGAYCVNDNNGEEVGKISKLSLKGVLFVDEDSMLTKRHLTGLTLLKLANPELILVFSGDECQHKPVMPYDTDETPFRPYGTSMFEWLYDAGGIRICHNYRFYAQSRTCILKGRVYHKIPCNNWEHRLIKTLTASTSI